MLRIALDDRPIVPHTIKVQYNGDEHELTLRYHAWTPEELAPERKARLELSKAIGQDDRSTGFDMLIQQSSANEIARMREVLQARVLGWDLADLEGNPVPLSPDTLQSALSLPGWLAAFWGGLFEASDGARAKNS